MTLGLLLALALARPPQAVAPAVGSEPRSVIGPAPPVAPEVITRAADGKATLRAVRLTAPLRFDGRLDDAAYAAVKPLTGFFQTIPDTGQPATQRTEAWVLFDRAALYVSARCWDTRPESEWTANEMRRDQIGGQDTFGIALDTFFDRRNGYIFYTNPLGAQSDTAVTNETGINSDFNPVWEVKTGRFDGGWTVEMRIPFTSLRYQPGSSQVWGVQLRRTVRARNEYAFLTPLAAGVQAQGLSRISLAATLVGLDAPSGSRNLEVKPYAIASVTTDRVAVPPVVRHPSADAGVDVKYGVTQNLTADFTYNTDVAAAEADDQQVNLTRFNLSLPEKRDFFLEGRGIFEFGAAGPSLFYSRQVGLNRGRAVPILWGGRMTGKVGRTSLGVLDMATGEETVSAARPTNFAVLRVRQDVLRRSTVGAMFTNRSDSLVRAGSASPAYGVDGAFAFYENVNVDASYAASQVSGVARRAAWATKFTYDPDTWGVTATQLVVDKGFNPEVGFVPRDDISQTSASLRYSPRPRNVPHVERFLLTGDLAYTHNTAGLLESRTETATFRTELKDTDAVSVGASRDVDHPVAPFRIAPGIIIPVGGYTFYTVRGSYVRGTSRRVSGTWSVDHGGFYGGHDSTLGYTGRVSLTPLLSAQPAVSVHWIRLPVGSFTSQLYRARLIYTVTPQMYVAGLVQYNTSNHVVGLNVRLRWEYRKGSELFVVYNENQDAQPVRGGGADLLDRSIAVKVNRLFRF